MGDTETRRSSRVVVQPRNGGAEQTRGANAKRLDGKIDVGKENNVVPFCAGG
ncbi:hypothetical protein Vi05172_g10220 [Venturia inaequalis]|nr:hypothetical protein Vi05172_g10220 [Venturia inaequalis]